MNVALQIYIPTNDTFRCHQHVSFLEPKRAARDLGTKVSRRINRELRLVGIVSALAVALTSCVSADELRREDEATCVGYGFHPDTDAFATCLQRESLARRALTSYPPPPYFGYWGYWGGWWGRSGFDRRLLSPVGITRPILDP